MSERTPVSSTSLQVPSKLSHPEGRRDLVRQVAQVALATAYRGLQQDNPERFTRSPDRPLLRRLYYETEDGWRAPLFRVEPLPGATGEPVVIAHGLGVNRHSLDFDDDLSLARTLRDAGFAVFLFEHRGDRTALPPPNARGFDFDDIASQDVPAAIDAVLDDTGYRKALFVGHALGGQLLYGALAHMGTDTLAAATTLCAPVRFPKPRTGARALSLASRLLPKRGHLPTRAAAALLAPGSRPGRGATAMLSGLGTNGEVTRGVMLHGAEDLGLGLVRQVLRWLEAGSLVDRDDRLDYVDALRGLTLPLQIVASHGDPLCPPSRAVPVLESLQGPRQLELLDAGWGHLDPLLGARAHAELFPRIVDWLSEHRRGCW